MVEVDYFISLISPWTYMGHHRLLKMAGRHGARVNFIPMDLGKVFPVSGGLPLAKRSPQRQSYRMMELPRWRDLLGIPLVLEPRFFPVPEQAARRSVVAVILDGGNPEPLIFAILRAVWAEERDISDTATLREILSQNGFDGEGLLERATTPDVASAETAFSQQAIDAGVFGAPTYRVGAELFWGQDRLEFVDRALARAAG